MAPFASTERRATALYGPAHRPAADRLRKSHNLPDAKIRTMVKSHLQFAKLLEDKGAGGLALTILRDGIFKPTPRGKKPLVRSPRHRHCSLGIPCRTTSQPPAERYGAFLVCRPHSSASARLPVVRLH